MFNSIVFSTTVTAIDKDDDKLLLSTISKRKYTDNAGEIHVGNYKFYVTYPLKVAGEMVDQLKVGHRIIVDGTLTSNGGNPYIWFKDDGDPYSLFTVKASSISVNGPPLKKAEIKHYSDLCVFIFQGNLGRDPEMRYTPSGTAVTNFSGACNLVYGSGDKQVKETTWVRFAAWGKQAEVCNEYLKKGSLVLIKGVLIADPDTGAPRIFKRNDGEIGASYEVTVMSMKLQPRNGGGGGGQSPYQGPGAYANDDDEEIPF